MRNPIKVLRGVRAFFTLARDPNRLGDVFAISDGLTDPKRLQEIVEFFRKDPNAARSFVDQPRIRVDLVALGRLPEGTLGRTFADHMRNNGLDPAAIPTLPSGDDGAYARAHLYETHDIWHVATGFGTDVAGELGLQAFYLAQFPAALSLAILAGSFLNTLIYAQDQREPRMESITRGWLLGRRAKLFFGVRWSEMWSVPLDEVRARLGVDLESLDRDIEPKAPAIAMAA